MVKCFTQSAFTLIELLVVIAIIAILAAMLLPALQGARDRAKGTSCISRQKQVVTAIMNYADDWDSFRPPGSFKHGETTIYYCRMLSENNYITKNEVLHCPLFPDAQISRTGGTTNDTYGLLREGPYDPETRWGSKDFVKIKSIMPSQDVMIVDSVKTRNSNLVPSAVPQKNYQDHPMYAGHGKKLTLGFYDGHVDMLPGDGLTKLRSFRGPQPSGLKGKYTMVFADDPWLGSKLNVVEFSMPEEI